MERKNLQQQIIPWAYETAESDVIEKIVEFNSKFEFDVILPVSVDDKKETINILIMKRDYVFDVDPVDYVRYVFEGKIKPSFTLDITQF